MSGNTTPVGSTRATAEFEIADADGTVTVRKLVSKGERLEIASGDDSVKLDSLLLEGLSWQPDTEALSALIDGEGADEGRPAGVEPVHGTAGAASGAAEQAGDEAAERDADGAAEQAGAPVDGTDEISISNEYSLVTARKVDTGAGEALELTTPGRGTSLTLDAATLRDLAAVEDTYVFSVWFKTPFGPEDAPLEGPL